jgi:hypothetical protein
MSVAWDLTLHGPLRRVERSHGSIAVGRGHQVSQELGGSHSPGPRAVEHLRQLLCAHSGGHVRDLASLLLRLERDCNTTLDMPERQEPVKSEWSFGKGLHQPVCVGAPASPRPLLRIGCTHIRWE